MLDSILEDGDLRDEGFEDTMEMFKDTLLQNTLDLDVDISNDPLIDFEASLEPIMLGDDMMNSFDNIVDVEPLDTENETSASDPDGSNAINQYSSINDIEPYTLSVMKPAAERDEDFQRKVQSENTVDDQTQESNVITSPSTKGKKSSGVKIGNRNPSNTKAESIKESKNKPSSSSDGNKYRDCSLMSDEDAVAGISYENLRGRTKEVFPVKLHKIMEYSERYGFSSIISWMPHGRSFKIHDEDLFVEKVMSHFFFQSKMSSFTRQLRMYGFHKIKGKNNVDKGAYFHELFLRGRPGLCLGIVRLERPCSLHKNDEPSFYLYPPMPSCNEAGDLKPKSETPKIIRYSDSTSTEKPVLLNKRPLNASSGMKNIISNSYVHNKCLNAVNPSITGPQIFQNLGGLPQTMNGNIGKNVQVIYVIQGGPASTNLFQCILQRKIDCIEDNSFNHDSFSNIVIMIT